MPGTHKSFRMLLKLQEAHEIFKLENTLEVAWLQSCWEIHFFSFVEGLGTVSHVGHMHYGLL